jgi:hypothetical protein
MHGIILQLVNEETKQKVSQSHSRIRGLSFFRKPRDMSLEISLPVSLATDLVLLTFVLVWTERRNWKVMEAGFL